MSGSSRLAAHRAAASANDVPETQNPAPDALGGKPQGNEPDTNTIKEKATMDEAAMKAAVEAARTEGHTAGFTEANERMKAVFASEHYAGRETLAAKMLGKPGLSAEDITDVLADAPKVEPKAEVDQAAANAAAEEAARKEMKEAINSGTNANIDASGGSKPNAKDPWDSVLADIAPNNKAA